MSVYAQLANFLPQEYSWLGDRSLKGYGEIVTCRPCFSTWHSSFPFWGGLRDLRAQHVHLFFFRWLVYHWSHSEYFIYIWNLGYFALIPIVFSKSWGTTVAQWLRCCATNRKVAGLIPARVSGFFIDIKSFRSHYGPGIDSASNRNEYQVFFLRVKANGAQGLQTYHRPVPLSWNLGTLTSWKPLSLSTNAMGLI